ncbi:MAG: dihydrofolate reductase [Erysipelotrichia bacterium]|nr:dihydrofolate reductase [Erysipelotrichia bacterium]
MIIAILNCDLKYGIGKRNGLLFSLPLDMQYFRETTLGHVVCMGENTLLSLPGSKPLKNRTNIVLSQDPTHNYEGVINVHSFEEFLKKIKKYEQNNKIFIIGGASIYKQTLPYVDEVHLTKINADGGAEVFFVNIDEHPDFQLVQESPPVLDGNLEIKFTIYKNLNKKEIS